MAMKFDTSRNAAQTKQAAEKVDADGNAIVTKNLLLSVIVENKDNESIYGMEKLDELMLSIEEDGFTAPIGVYDLKDGTYEIFSGHKRYRAMKMLGKKRIQATIYPMPKDNAERAKRLILSNALNRDYSPVMKARELQFFYDNVIVPGNKPGKKREQLAKAFGMSDAQVARLLSLLKLIPQLQELSDHPDLAASAFSLAAQLSDEQQLQLYEYVERSKNDEGGYTITRKEIAEYIKRLQNPIVETTPVPATPSSDAPALTEVVAPNYADEPIPSVAERVQQMKEPVESAPAPVHIPEPKTHFLDTTDEDALLRSFDERLAAYTKEKEQKGNVLTSFIDSPMDAEIPISMEKSGPYIDSMIKDMALSIERLDMRSVNIRDEEKVKTHLAIIKEFVKDLELNFL